MIRAFFEVGVEGIALACRRNGPVGFRHILDTGSGSQESPARSSNPHSPLKGCRPEPRDFVPWRYFERQVSNHQLSWWYGGEPLKAV